MVEDPVELAPIEALQDETPRVRKHVLITGTGRAGTSFLVQLLTHLGLDTGFTPEALKLLPFARAGLETGLWTRNPPYIVKSPFACDVDESLFRGRDRIEHAIIPVRRFEAAAASRVHVQQEATGRRDGPKTPGGLWGTEIADQQAATLRFKFTNLIETLVSLDVPITFLRYPGFIREPDYLYEKLRWLLGDVAWDRFHETFARVVKPEWIHQFGDDDC